MSCIKQKSFLFLKWTVVYHEMKMFRVYKFMHSSESFIVEYKCDKCARVYARHFVENDTLLKEGISQDILNRITDRHWYYTQTKELK